MIYFLRDFFYFNNETHYLKNLSNKNNTKDFNGIIQGKKKYSFIQIFILLLIIIIFCSISIYSYIKIFFISMTIFILINLIAKIIITNNFSNSYFDFIKLCEVIVKFENKVKNKIKMKSFLKNDSSETELILNAIIKEIKSILNINIENNNKEITLFSLFNEYQNIKQKLFKFIFLKYEKEYIINELYIIIFINYFLNYSTYLNYNMNILINKYKECIQKLDIDEINFETLFQGHEKYINTNIINSKEKKINELNISLLNLFESNYKLNEYYIKLLKEINLQDNNKHEKINEIIEYIIEKKKLSISLLEQIKSRINSENKNKNNIINNNKKTVDNIQKNINNFIKRNNNNNEISLSDIQLNNYNYDNQRKERDENETKKDVKNKSKKNYDVIKEQEKMEILKSDLIDELNKYCKSKQNLNKNESEDNNENINNTKVDLNNNNIDEKNKEIDFNKNQFKLDFAKTLTMSLKKNKNFNFNTDENKKDDK